MRRTGCLLIVTVLLAAVAADCARAEEPQPPIGDAWQDARNPIVRIFGGQRLDLWSLKPIVRPRIEPRTESDAWHEPIDALLRPAPPESSADRRALARRLWFDLVGLPPTPEDVAKFVADQRPDAYERLIDRLLASPRHGEHAARMWLDVVRYSDSNGFDWDEFRPAAWRYRDYVIRALNADKPYDQFVSEQLAGDELLDGPPRSEAEQDMLLATGYLRLGPWDNAAPLFNEQSRARHELLVDLTETTGGAFLGLTLSCCRCHDHKHDPLSQADHYRLRAFFENVEFADDLPIDLAADQEAIAAHNSQVDERTAPLKAERDALWDAAKSRAAAIKSGEPTDDEIKTALSEEERKRHEALTKELAELERSKRKATHALLMREKSDPPPATHVLFQGNHQQPREAVAPGFLSILDPSDAAIAPRGGRQSGSRRLTLAEWIASRQNPLTARVLANRLWQGHFAEAIVGTPNDFGLAGERPSHPELLDGLASELVNRGWSIKTVRRRIVQSAVYRAGGVDGATMPRRLTAEQLRDSLLAVSGLLTPKAGGPPVWPTLPEDVLKANPAFLDDNETKTKGWYPSPPHEQHARSIYVVQKRTVRVPFLETFDLPENMVSCACRNTSTVAPQALSLLNSPLAADVSHALAQRVRLEAGDGHEMQVRRLFEISLQRQPEPDELADCLAFLKQGTLDELARVVLNLNEFLYLD